MLNYQLDVKGSQLIVKLGEQNTRRILYFDTLKASAISPCDAKAVAFLAKLHIRAHAGRSIDTLSFQEIAIPASHSNEAIRLMIQTARFSFRGALLVAEKKQAQLFWTGELHSEKSATLEAHLQLSCGQIPLQSANFVFPGAPIWAIIDTQWVEIDTSLPWKWVELFSKGPIVLEGMQKKRFLEESPNIRWNAKAIPAAVQVLPILMLSDETGSFANLWMEYSGAPLIAFEDLAPQINGHTRRKAEEIQWEKDLVESGYLRKIVGTSRYYCPGEKVQETLQFLLELGWQCLDAQKRKILLQSGFSMKITEKDRIQMEGTVQFQEKETAFSNAMAASKKGRLLLPLDHQSTGLLQTKALPALEGVWQQEILTISKQRIGELKPLLDLPEVTWEESLRRTVIGVQDPLVLDGRFRGTLLPYQQQGVEWLFFLRNHGFHGLLSDEMGLGKTVQVLAFFSQLRTNLPILIVAPTSLLFNWRAEIHRFWPEADVYVHEGPERLKIGSLLQHKCVVLSSYAILRLDIAFLQSIDWETIALDESQMIKSSHSLVAKATYELKGAFKIAITGTPIENRPEELWSQFRFLMPDLFGNRSDFLALPAEAVRRRVKPFILKRKKEEVQIQLPEKIDRHLWVSLTDEQQLLYDQTLTAFKEGLLCKIRAEGLHAHRMQVLEVILRIRQIACDPRLVQGDAAGAKAQLLLSMAEEWALADKKVVLFSQFASMLQLLRRDLQAIGIQPLYLDGSTPQEERGKLVCQFQQEPKPHLFLLSLKAGGVGLNLTAAEHVVLFDPWWNEAVELQAIDRAHRIGQKNTLHIHRLLTPNSIEEKMLHIKESKSSIADEFLSDATWSERDLMDLLY